MTYEMYRDGIGQWRWRLKATNGNVLADSGEGYSRRIDCEHGITAVKGSNSAPIVELPFKGIASKPAV